MSDFREKVLALLGGVPHMNARPHYAELLRTQGSTISLRWEWIKKPELLDSDEFDIFDGEEWVEVRVRSSACQVKGS